MFGRIYWKRILCGIRSKEIIFWTLLFPIALSTLFHFAFARLDSMDQMERIPVGVISGQQEKDPFLAVLKEVSQGEEALFEVREYEKEEKARQAFQDEKIEGYFCRDGKSPVLKVKENGIYQTIMKSFLEQYVQKEAAVTQLVAEGNKTEQLSLENVVESEKMLKEITMTANPPSASVMYFYALLGMICMYGGFQGVTSMAQQQANLSAVGTRVHMAPVRRVKMITADLLGGYTMHVACVLISLLYMHTVLQVDFGGRFLLAAVACLMGSAVGVLLGALIGTPKCWKFGAKIGMVVTVSMIFSYMAGLMVESVNYEIAKNVPILSWINPAARIADMFYSLYYYESLETYLLNLGILAVMAVALLAAAALGVRRQQYESI